MDARDVARGGMAKYAGYSKLNMYAGMCENTYLFKSEGWVNVNQTISLLILIPCLVVIFFAIPSDSERLVMPDLLLGRFAQPFAVAVVRGFVFLGEKTVWAFEKAVDGIRASGQACRREIVRLGGALRRLC